MLLYLNYPSFIKPEIIPGIPFLRWYSMMYLVGFAILFMMMKRLLKKNDIKGVDDKDLESFITAIIIGLLIGGRVFSTLVYDTTGKYWLQPWLIFWPFNERMQFTGLEGMSYHGALIGIIVGILIFCKKRRWSFWGWTDIVTTSAPIGYTFGRLGNFANQELYGRATTHSWGILFPNATPYSTSLPWVQEMANKLNIPLVGATVNLPRHPSQLYEAFLEGVVLWLLLWFWVYPNKKVQGTATVAYIFGYGFFRFFIEYLREPDSNLMFPIQWGNPDAAFSFLNFTTGQILNFLMMLGASLFYLYLLKRNDTTPLIPISKRQQKKEAKKK